MLAGSDDIGILFHIMFSQTIGSRLSRSSFQVVEIAILLLIVGQTLSHMVQHFFSKILCFSIGQILANPVSVKASFVHTYQTNGREMIIKGGQVTFGIRIKSGLEQLGNNGSLRLQATSSYIHHLVQTFVEFFLALS